LLCVKWITIEVFLKKSKFDDIKNGNTLVGLFENGELIDWASGQCYQAVEPDFTHVLELFNPKENVYKNEIIKKFETLIDKEAEYEECYFNHGINACIEILKKET